MRVQRSISFLLLFVWAALLPGLAQGTPAGTTPDKAASTPAAEASNAKTDAPKQDPPASNDDAAATIRKTVNEVNVVFTVTDKHGHYVRDLKKNDFKVLDDNRPAAEISSFHTESDLPLQVGLLVDASNSVRDRFKFEQE